MGNTMPKEKRFLICEDNEGTAERLREAIEEAFPCATVDVATTASEVMTKLENVARSPYSNYWFLLVDVHLKLDKNLEGPSVYVGDQPFIDRLMRDSNERVVFFMSAHLSDPKILKFQELCKRESRARPMFIAKDFKGYWITEILGWMRTIIYSRLVQDEIGQTFVEPRSHQTAAYGLVVGRNAHGAGDATQALAALARDIARYWTYLDRDTQLRVQEYFKVVVAENGVRVSMF